jgi:multidrug resistance efflux pump
MSENRPLPGFPGQSVSQKIITPVKPTPLPKRPKGRWFIGLLLVGACGYAGYQVWDSFFRYRAYGTVTGRVLEVSSPWEGVATLFHVREGELVHQGQLLVTLQNAELQQRHAQLADELRIAQATLEAESAKLKWQAAFHVDQSSNAMARYHETLGQLLQEESRLHYLQRDLARTQSLPLGTYVSWQDYDRIRFEKRGQEQKVSQLRTALEEHKKRSELSTTLLEKLGGLADSLQNDGSEQLKPILARIQALQAEQRRVQERLNQGQIHAPTNGLIVKINRFAGEHCRPAESVLSLLEDGSLQVVLYLQQGDTNRLNVGEQIQVSVAPYREPLTCTVVRFADRHEPAPEHLKRFYFSGQHLLPTYLQPTPETRRWFALRVGGVVGLPWQAPGLTDKNEAHVDRSDKIIPAANRN